MKNDNNYRVLNKALKTIFPLIKYTFTNTTYIVPYLTYPVIICKSDYLYNEVHLNIQNESFFIKGKNKKKSLKACSLEH